ncbi:uncharacterized protein GIQ15_01328 [Arthroderma uncinatum]|uniref:uncharacterized protein n=1 Tax=Arthroderma uncinatum TaxID=74035 RepID=UPI00144A6F22|nr:uncharacterized protein GIQ15_01328 [Arthroderma uncinatum]KAF3491811.1 hypothetical protein GIQ15_01328 [Arthroderma uncinatum]
MRVITLLADCLLWLAPRTFIRLAPESWLISLCHRTKKEKWLGNFQLGDRVIRLPGNVAVKYGAGVLPGEAATQHYAYQHVDPDIVRVPQVYRYFQDRSSPAWPTGYLFMEYIPGQNLKELINLDANDKITKRVTRIISHLGEIKGGTVPGPVGGGVPYGYLWGDDGAKTEFSSLVDVNAWINRRIELLEKTVDLTAYPLVLCHMDLCRRNIILMEDKSICLLDWGRRVALYRFDYQGALCKPEMDLVMIRRAFHIPAPSL